MMLSLTFSLSTTSVTGSIDFTNLFSKCFTSVYTTTTITVCSILYLPLLLNPLV